MAKFETKQLPKTVDAAAPDGSNVRLLLELPSGGMAHFELPPGQVSKAVIHQTVEEVWFFLSGCGEFWRCQGTVEEVVSVKPGVCITIPVATAFQFRSFDNERLTAVAVTMPPWPGYGEAIELAGKWEPTVP